MNEQVSGLLQMALTGAISGGGAGLLFYGKKAMADAATPKFDPRKLFLPVVVGAAVGIWHGLTGVAGEVTEATVGTYVDIAGQATILSALGQLTARGGGASWKALVGRFLQK